MNQRIFDQFRDLPFNLQGGLWFLFRSEFFLRTTRELEYLFPPPEYNIRLYDKNSESDFFFSSTKIRIFFSATLEIRIFFLGKKHNPPPPPPFKLNGRSLSEHGISRVRCRTEWFIYLYPVM